jgi:RHS repeat-associated protein
VITGKERDYESGLNLDYFGARYFSAAQGRFTSPDPIAGSLANPQSLNRYTYALNNPLKFIDPTGMVVEWADSKKTCNEGETECLTSAQRAYEDRIRQLQASKNAKERANGGSLAETYWRLKDSKAVFRVMSEAGNQSSGRISFDGSLFTISLKGDASAYGAITQNQKIAHEFEHGRQVLDNELSFQNYNPPDWNPWAYDRTDEAKAFAAGFNAEPANPAQGAFIQGMSRALTGGLLPAVEFLQRSGSTYRNLPAGPINVQHRSPAIYEVPK